MYFRALQATKINETRKKILIGWQNLKANHNFNFKKYSNKFIYGSQKNVTLFMEMKKSLSKTKKNPVDI